MNLMLLTGAGVLDDILDGLQCPEGAMFKFWLESVQCKGNKNSLKD